MNHLKPMGFIYDEAYTKEVERLLKLAGHTATSLTDAAEAAKRHAEEELACRSDHWRAIYLELALAGMHPQEKDQPALHLAMQATRFAMYCQKRYEGETHEEARTQAAKVAMKLQKLFWGQDEELAAEIARWPIEAVRILRETDHKEIKAKLGSAMFRVRCSGPAVALCNWLSAMCRRLAFLDRFVGTLTQKGLQGDVDEALERGLQQSSKVAEAMEACNGEA